MLKIAVIDLKNALALTVPIANRKTSLPILQNVALTEKDGALVVSATNLEQFVRVTVTSVYDIHPDFAITLPANFLNSVLSTIPPTAKLAIDVHAVTKRAKIQVEGTTGGTMNMAGISIDEFPTVPQESESTGGDVKLGNLTTTFAKVIPFAATDISRPTLTGIKFDASENRLTMVATDGYRLSEWATEYRGEAFSGIVPSVGLTDAIKAGKQATDGDNTIASIGVDDNRFRVAFSLSNGEYEYISTLIDAKYPDYKAIIPKQATTTMSIVSEEMAALLSAPLLYARDNNLIVRLRVNPESPTIFAQSPESGDIVLDMPCAITGEALEIAINGQYFQTALKLLSGPVMLEFTQPNRPMMVKTNNADGLFVVMPMHSPR